MCVLFNYLSWLKSKYACDTKWAACDLYFVHCTWVILRVLHDSKDHVSNASCTAHESVFLCAACRLTAIRSQWSIKAYDKKAPQQSGINHVGMKKIIFCQVFMSWFTYPYSNPLWMIFYWTNWMPNTIMAQGLDITGNNNLTRLVTQCAHVISQSALRLRC